MREMQRVVAGFLAVALLILPTTAVAAVNGEGLQSGGGEGSGTSSSLEDGYGRDTPLGETAVPTTDGESPDLTWTIWGFFGVLGLCLCWSWVVWVWVLGN